MTYLFATYSCNLLRAQGVPNKVCALIVGPCLLALVLSVIITFLGHKKIPHTLDRSEWTNFTKSIETAVNIKNANEVIGVLLLVQALQVLFCMPLLHITRILYGFFFGTVVGGLIGCIWELGLIFVAVMMCVYKQSDVTVPTNFMHIFDYVENLRKNGQLYTFLIVLQMASIPLFTSLILVSYQVVSVSEFFISHAIVTIIMTFKDTFLGNFVAISDGRTEDVVIGIVIFTLSTVLPSLITVIISCVCSHHVIQLVNDIRTNDDKTNCMSEQLITKNSKGSLEKDVSINDSGYNSDNCSDTCSSDETTPKVSNLSI